MRLINKILFEATFEKDSNRNNEIKNIIDKIENAFYSYNGSNTEIFRVNKNDGVAVYKNNEITIMLFDKNYPSKFSKSSKADYNRGNNIISLYNCTIDWNNEENRWNYFDFDRDSLYHELVHFYDYQNINYDNYDKIKINTSNISKDQYSKYLNHGTEFNAHFMQYVMPIVTMIKNYWGRRYDIKNFDDFKKEIFSSHTVKEFYNYLTPKMKKHFIKRIAEYYQKIKKEKDNATI